RARLVLSDLVSKDDRPAAKTLVAETELAAKLARTSEQQAAGFGYAGLFRIRIANASDTTPQQAGQEKQAAMDLLDRAIQHYPGHPDGWLWRWQWGALVTDSGRNGPAPAPNKVKQGRVWLDEAIKAATGGPYQEEISKVRNKPPFADE